MAPHRQHEFVAVRLEDAPAESSAPMEEAEATSFAQELGCNACEVQRIAIAALPDYPVAHKYLEWASRNPDCMTIAVMGREGFERRFGPGSGAIAFNFLRSNGKPMYFAFTHCLREQVADQQPLPADSDSEDDGDIPPLVYSTDDEPEISSQSRKN